MNEFDINVEVYQRNYRVLQITCVLQKKIKFFFNKTANSHMNKIVRYFFIYFKHPALPREKIKPPKTSR